MNGQPFVSLCWACSSWHLPQHCDALMYCWDIALNGTVKKAGCIVCVSIAHCVLHPYGPHTLYSISESPLRPSEGCDEMQCQREACNGLQLSCITHTYTQTHTRAQSHIQTHLLSKEAGGPEGLLDHH